MRGIVRKLHHFIFDRRTVTRADAADQIEAVQRRPVQVVAHERMRARVRRHDVTIQLRTRERARAPIREEQRFGTRRLHAHARVVDAPRGDARRRPRLEPASREPGRAQRIGERECGRLPDASRRFAVFAAIDLSAEKRPRREDDATRAVGDAVLRHDAAHDAAFDQEIGDEAAHDR